MAGITSIGAYIPAYRMKAEVVSRVWGKGSRKGERSVANYDEDSLTMAVEAVMDCLRSSGDDRVDSLYFASTTSPYREKQCASIVAAAADLEGNITTMDFANSLRAGSNALRAALDAVRGGASRRVLITAADCRLGYPQSPEEQTCGDGAAAVEIGSGRVMAEIEDSLSIADDITDVWRKETDHLIRSWENRWVLSYGYERNVRTAVSGLLKKTSLKPTDFTRVIIPAPDARSHQGVARSLGFEVHQLQDPMLDTVGNTGTAHSLLMLAAALEESAPGDRLLFVSYGDGADAFSIRATEEIAKARRPLGVRGKLSRQRVLAAYGKYLAFRHLVPLPEEFVRLFPAATVMWRTRDWSLRGHGSKCLRCGMVTFPIQRVCYRCGSKDEYYQVRLTNKKGTVFTYSVDNLAGSPDAPVVQTIVESEEGNARIYCLMTDCDPSGIKVGMPVEFTFRRFHEMGGFINYFWKCRPART